MQSSDSADSITSVNSTNSSGSFDIVGDIHQVESTADIDDNDATIDISADSVSLFSRLLTITNKNGAASGTVAVNLTNSQIENDGDENKVITPTILQNGRPVSAQLVPMSANFNFYFFISEIKISIFIITTFRYATFQIILSTLVVHQFVL